jgi:uncharacterized protein YbjT (DUF2867 family)
VAVEALTKGREHENKAYSITGPEAVSNYEIANILSNIIDRKVTYVNISDDDARKAMKENGMQAEKIVEFGPKWFVIFVTASIRLTLIFDFSASNNVVRMKTTISMVSSTDHNDGSISRAAKCITS